MSSNHHTYYTVCHVTTVCYVTISNFLTDFDPELSVAVEGERKIKQDWSLHGGMTEFSQAYATAIVFSFLCHYKFGMRRSSIPSLLVSPQAFAVFFTTA